MKRDAATYKTLWEVQQRPLEDIRATGQSSYDKPESDFLVKAATSLTSLSPSQAVPVKYL